MASDFEKPNKTHTLFPDEIQKKMWPLPISSLFMAGHASVAVLQKLDIHTIGDLARMDPAILSLHLKSHGKMLWEYANGIDNSSIESEPSQAKDDRLRGTAFSHPASGRKAASDGCICQMSSI